MGKYDRCMKAYLQDKRRFANLFNGSCFQGRQVIRAEDLEEASESYVVTEEKQPGKPLQKGTEIIRDVKMRYRSGMILQVLAVENQSYIDYGMPVRCMGYDAAEYSRQMCIRDRSGCHAGQLAEHGSEVAGISKAYTLSDHLDLQLSLIHIWRISRIPLSVSVSRRQRESPWQVSVPSMILNWSIIRCV